METKTKKEVVQEEMNASPESKEKDGIFRTQEIKIEEMAIDGICGVY